MVWVVSGFFASRGGERERDRRRKGEKNLLPLPAARLRKEKNVWCRQNDIVLSFFFFNEQ